MSTKFAIHEGNAFPDDNPRPVKRTITYSLTFSLIIGGCTYSFALAVAAVKILKRRERGTLRMLKPQAAKAMALAAETEESDLVVRGEGETKPVIGFSVILTSTTVDTQG